MSTDLAHDLDESGPVVQQPNGMWECCAINNPQSLCFEYLELNSGIVELPPHMCLPTRKIIESSIRHCYQNTKMCPENTHCIKPLLSNITVLLTMKRKNENDNVIYIGHPSDVFLTVTVSSYVPKYIFPNYSIASILNRLLKYLIVFSSGLALVNSLPCICFDGQHIVNCIIALILRKRTRHKVQIVSMVIVVIGTILLFTNFVFTLWTLAFRK